MRSFINQNWYDIGVKLLIEKIRLIILKKLKSVIGLLMNDLSEGMLCRNNENNNKPTFQKR
jgi:hypothetical protein